VGLGAWSAVALARPALSALVAAPRGSSHCGDRALASRLRGDSVLLNPSAVAWAWAAVLAAHGMLSEGCGLHGCGGVVVPLERLLRVLGSADVEGPGIATVLLRALADLGLVCPIPSLAVLARSAHSDQRPSWLGCNWVLVPDFAGRVNIFTATGDIGVGPEEKQGDANALAPLSARLVFDSPGEAPPCLRATLRDFLASGAVGGTSGANAKCIEVRHFSLLGAGPSPTSQPLVSDDLAPGFLLTFDLAPVLQMATPEHDGAGAPVAESPAPVWGSTSSGTTAKGETPRIAAADAGQSPTGDNKWANSAVRPTTVVVGAATADTNGQAGSGHKAASSSAFWDVHCSGPHAQWAWRALLGGGGTGFSANFRGIRRSPVSSKARSNVSIGSSPGVWPLTPPACTLTQTAVNTGAFSQQALQTPAELIGLGWLLSAPEAADARAVLHPRGLLQGGNPIAECCAALCGKNVSLSVSSGLEDDSEVEGLLSCADFEAAMLGRSLRTVRQQLEEALAAGGEAWALCTATLARLAHDSAAAVAGARGRGLPLLCISEARGGSPGTVALISDVLLPIVGGLPPPAELPAKPLGGIRTNAGVEAWLRLCRPAALWSAAVTARWFGLSAANAQRAVTDGIGEQVAEALKAAFAVQLTEQMVSEVWNALGEVEGAGSLARRAGGAWMMMPPPPGGKGGAGGGLLL